MKNREVYVKDPAQNRLLNNGVASVTDAVSAEERRTLRFELETFVCDGEYARGLERILRTFLDNLYQSEQPGVWVSGFFGSGKSHLVKMLRALWVDFTFPEDNATARGLVKVPPAIADLLKELDNAQRREGGIHAASGTLGAGVGDNVRLALLAIVFRSVGLSEQYPLARFELWLKELGYFDAVRGAVEAEGKEWHSELRSLYASPLIAKALLDVYPDLAPSPMEVRKLLREQFPNAQDVSNQQMVDAIRDALSRDGKFPITLVGLDEVQQYIGENQSRTYAIQEVTETCCKKFGGKLVFVGTGQTALSGTPNLQKLMGRFPVGIELSDTDVDAVIRQVILAKKPGAIGTIDKTITENLGEISRHLTGTKLEHRSEDREVLTPDYPILPVRRRFWERTLRAVDQGGTAGQLRNQLKVVHEAARTTADDPLGTVVAGDFIFHQIAPNLLQTGVLSREIYDYIRSLQGGSEADELKARLCGLTYLIGKLPREAGADLGVRATADTLADLLVKDLKEGSAKLRKDIPALLGALEQEGKVMRVGDEYRLQTRESSAWNDEYRSQLSRIMGNPQRIAQERVDLFRKECAERLKGLRLTQGKCKESRSINVHFGSEPPAELGKAVHVWFRDGWEEEEKAVLADARAAGNASPTIYVYLPRRSADELRKTLASLRAATATLQVRGVPGTAEGEEARNAMQTTESTSERRLALLLDEAFSGARVFQGGGQEVVAASLFDAVKEAADNALVRLYPKFDEADHVGWSKVIDRARKGSEAALEVVDYQGDVDKHPVTSALIKYVAVGKKGADVRKQFEEPEYGWPRDAIDGGVYALVATGHLRATDSAGKVLDAKSLDRAKITQTHFRIESTTVTTVQRIQLRKMLTDVGVSCNAGEELSAMPEFFRIMRELAASAGGEPPRPESPSTVDLEELAAFAGNEQLVAVHAKRDELLQWSKDWRATATAIQGRIGRWQTLEGLLQQAGGLAEADDVQAQADAILDGRLLLADPDPVPGLVDQLTQLLRDALIKARDAYQAEFDRGAERLAADANWEQLTPEQRHALRLKQHVTKVPDIKTGTTHEVLTSLRSMPLATWADRTAALPTRFDAILREAAELVLPDPVFVKVKGATVTNAGDLDAWIESVRQQVKDALDKADGAPVVIS